MNIYDLNKRKLWKLLVKFSKCEYGKIQFVISYSLFLVLMILLIVFFVCLFVTKFRVFLLAIIIDSLFAFISFVIGSAHFYTEVRYFAYHEEKNNN